MNNPLVYIAGTTKACQLAAEYLKKHYVEIVDHPTPEVSHLLLDVPSFSADNALRGGGSIKELLRMLPREIVIVGGNLNHPALDEYTVIDLLQDARYLAANAAITAECALQIAAANMDATFADSPTLVIGWGRIGKCLARLLRSIGADVTVAARKEADLAMLNALGYPSCSTDNLNLSRYRLVLNTVPELILRKEDTQGYPVCTMIDLASKRGIEGETVILARGLPGVYAPESSGALIADTVLRCL